ncbi:sugar phosphate nucleotidyltransferase [Riemerella anatipestifer]|uniref:CTP:phosphocholine cytidylyltransferase involved in choline phosphorylation for cell surface LPS epitopes n=2 Tax=Riemerella anatipestifer TaxID=34085 RepID=J9R3M6_RIEAN|nr:sugar phosphate nucleotidyltransferase [Riemerella anatipestifer]AFR35028.1 CTP:phosphocholine cytidylyltransferase involved in choline phosphorylation for cell surface LPS epitopes [Riemerella anatipestifer RA-CH-1]AIH02040.1 Glucose-1-phosphate thymidylyltransferase [Riemerella anatipestifer CH3]MBT0572859.1 NTP transferase domain-containing protein [Riemerella anatipestifer]MCO7332098.1 sugar phosphate nucleotidyltransferase [Riemerella anatipestifer]MCO7351069.1 sugar phosphate nucleoti
MKIIVPMAGRGSRLRPHTLTVPKPLIPIAGKPIVQRLVEDIAKVAGQPIEEVTFIIGDFGDEVKASLIQIAEKLGAKGSVYTQDEPLGTAHAIKCAEASMQGDVVVAFADTLFRADFVLDTNSDGVIWVKKVEDPSAFGVVKLDDYGFITDFVEKPQTFVSDLAIIGIYYFKSAEKLMEEINYIMDNNIMQGGEYQLTTALENLRQKGAKFSLGKVNDWMDCGNKNATVETNSKILQYEKEAISSFPSSAKIENSLIIPPCFIGENVVIKNSKIGPNVSLGNNTEVVNSNIDNSLIQEKTLINHGNLSNSMIGNSAKYFGVSREISLGDYSVLDFLSK